MKINKFIKIWNSILDSLRLTEIKEKANTPKQHLESKNDTETVPFGEFDELFDKLMIDRSIVEHHYNKESPLLKMISDGYIPHQKILEKIHYFYIDNLNPEGYFHKYPYSERYPSYNYLDTIDTYLKEKNIDILGIDFFNTFLELNDPNYKTKNIFKSFFSLDDSYHQLNQTLAIEHARDYRNNTDKELNSSLDILKEHPNPVMKKLLNINIYKHPALFFEKNPLYSMYTEDDINGKISHYRKITSSKLLDFWNNLSEYSNIKKTISQETFFSAGVKDQFMYPLIQRLVENNQISPKDFFEKHLKDSNNNKQCVAILLLMMYPEQIEPLLTTENLEVISTIPNTPDFIKNLYTLHIKHIENQKKETLLKKWDSYKNSIYVENNNCIEVAKQLNLSDKTLKLIQSIEELKIENPLIEENNFISNLKSKIIDSLISYDQLTLIGEKDAELILQNTLLEFKKDFNNILEQKNTDSFKSLSNNLKFAKR